MGEDVASLAETYAEDPYKSKLIGKTEKLDDTKYKNQYAEAHGIEKDSKEYDNIDEDDIAYMLAYNKALEEVEDNTEDYIKLLKDKKLNRILLIATGALTNATTSQQGESIPGIAHAVSIEN